MKASSSSKKRDSTKYSVDGGVSIFGKGGFVREFIANCPFITRADYICGYQDRANLAKQVVNYLMVSEYEKYCTDVGELEGTMFRFREEKVKVTKEVYVFSEKEKDKMLEAAEVLRKLAEDHPSDSDDETLKYLAQTIPYVFSKGSKNEEFARFRPQE